MDYEVHPDTMDVFTDAEDTVIVDSENIVTIIKHNDVGVSIDIYDKNIAEPSDESLIHSTQHWFNEYT